MSAIRCRGLTAWRKGEQVLKGVDLLVEPGEVCLLLGAPDSGRTRLVELILGLRRPASGSVEVLETTPGEVPLPVGYLPRQLTLYEHMSPAQNLKLVADTVGEKVRTRTMSASGEPDDSYLLGGRDSDDILKQVAIINPLLLRTMRFKPPEEKWRVQLAASCLTAPDRLLVLDAPDRTLDHTGLEILRERLGEVIREGKAALVTADDPLVLGDVATSYAILRDGIIADRGRLPAGDEKYRFLEALRETTGRAASSSSPGWGVQPPNAQQVTGVSSPSPGDAVRPVAGSPGLGRLVVGGVKANLTILWGHKLAPLVVGLVWFLAQLPAVALLPPVHQGRSGLEELLDILLCLACMSMATMGAFLGNQNGLRRPGACRFVRVGRRADWSVRIGSMVFLSALFAATFVGIGWGLKGITHATDVTGLQASIPLIFFSCLFWGLVGWCVAALTRSMIAAVPVLLAWLVLDGLIGDWRLPGVLMPLRSQRMLLSISFLPPHVMGSFPVLLISGTLLLWLAAVLLLAYRIRIDGFHPGRK